MYLCVHCWLWSTPIGTMIENGFLYTTRTQRRGQTSLGTAEAAAAAGRLYSLLAREPAGTSVAASA